MPGAHCFQPTTGGGSCCFHCHSTWGEGKDPVTCTQWFIRFKAVRNWQKHRLLIITLMGRWVKESLIIHYWWHSWSMWCLQVKSEMDKGFKMCVVKYAGMTEFAPGECIAAAMDELFGTSLVHWHVQFAICVGWEVTYAALMRMNVYMSSIRLCALIRIRLTYCVPGLSWHQDRAIFKMVVCPTVRVGHIAC